MITVDSNMAVLALLTIALFAGSACSSSQVSRIVGGTETTIDQFPSIVQVENLGVFTGIWTQACGGSILTRRDIMSGAACVVDPFYRPEMRRIRAGSTYRQIGGIVSYVERAFVHPTYGKLGSDGDIAVIRLITPLDYSPVIQQGAIISQGFMIPDGMPVIQAGWGLTTQGGSYSDVLRTTTVITVSRELCAQQYATLPRPDPVTENMICHGIPGVGGSDRCQGDTGGPLYFDNIIIGVLSWGYGCANETFPGVSTSVASYTNWIIEKAV